MREFKQNFLADFLLTSEIQIEQEAQQERMLKQLQKFNRKTQKPPIHPLLNPDNTVNLSNGPKPT